MHRLTELYERLARDNYPPRDDGVEVVGAPPGKASAVVAFTQHHVIAVDVDADAIRSRLDPHHLGAPMRPAFLAWLGEELGGEAGSLAVVMYAKGRGIGSNYLVARDDLGDHPRVRRALRWRDDVRLYGDPVGSSVLVLGRGLAGRMELTVEVPASQRRASTGRRLVQAALDQLPRNEPVFAQIAAGNAASLRAFYNSGFRPIGAEVLFRTGEGPEDS
ncbi:MAG: GNAT family N-acetyltransferase [Acidimicrobiia bacterium]